MESTSTLVGYFAKRSVTPPPWMAELGIREVASVSECISGGPDEWVQAWKHNAWGFFDSPDLAWSVVPEKDRAGFSVYAYKLHATESGAEDWPAAGTTEDVLPLPESFGSIGYDVVSRSAGTFFECSPLSCNHLAREFVTNDCCLLSERHQAVVLARDAESLRCEPGPYFVLEVFREP